MRALTQHRQGIVPAVSAGGVGGAAGVDPGVVGTCRAQFQALPLVLIGHPGPGDQWMAIFQPGEAGSRDTLHLTREDSREAQHHRDLGALA